MDAKEKKKIKDFLRSYEREESRIRQIEEDIAYINKTLDSIPQIFDGMPRGSGISNKTAKEAEKLWQLQNDLIAARTRAVQKREEVANLIRQVKNVQHMNLLRLRYIELKGWAQVSIDMDRDPRWVFRMHNLALEEILKIYNLTI
jgi:hypothetical protein